MKYLQASYLRTQVTGEVTVIRESGGAADFL